MGKQVAPATEAVGSTLAKAAQRAAKPVLAGGAAAAGIVSALAAGRVLRPKQRKVLGIPSVSASNLDTMARGVRKTGKQVGRTGEQLGRIAVDIQKTGASVERLGKLLAK